jgi:hypothetical protein
LFANFLFSHTHIQKIRSNRTIKNRRRVIEGRREGNLMNKCHEKCQ